MSSQKRLIKLITHQGDWLTEESEIINIINEKGTSQNLQIF